MRKLLILPILCALVVTSCSRESDSISPDIEKTRGSGYESDPNFVALVDSYVAVVRTANLRVELLDEAPRRTSTREILNLAGFDSRGDFRSYQFENSVRYNQLVKDYGLKSVEQLQELDDSLVSRTVDSYGSGGTTSSSCGGALVDCLVNALVAFNNYISTYGGVGCDWNPGSDCWDGMVAYESYTIDRMFGCIDDYLGC